jgi:hypothetical protein
LGAIDPYNLNNVFNSQIEAQSDRRTTSNALSNYGAVQCGMDYAATIAFEEKIFGQVGLQKQLYYYEHCGLSAQLIVRAIGEVSESYKGHRQEGHDFKPRSAVVYDQRILS